MCIFFCFHDSATTDIYTDCHTLSLPGALPIFAAAGVAGLDVAVGNGAQRGGLALGRPAAVVAHSVLDVGIDLAADPARAGAAAGAGDRKSTRLNSSH